MCVCVRCACVFVDVCMYLCVCVRAELGRAVSHSCCLQLFVCLLAIDQAVHWPHIVSDCAHSAGNLCQGRRKCIPRHEARSFSSPPPPPPTTHPSNTRTRGVCVMLAACVRNFLSSHRLAAQPGKVHVHAPVRHEQTQQPLR